jgi:MFS family permease
MAFNIGGLIGTLATVPIAHRFGRRVMFRMYFAFAALALFGTFGLDISPDIRLWGYFLLGLSVFGIFGSFTFYLPELFPTRLRATGSGFCYNIGRVLAAAGPYFVGFIASKGNLDLTMTVLFWLGLVPLVGAVLSTTKWVVETKKV